MRAPTHRDSERRFDSAMTPMIDVVFNLLVFFVCTVSFTAAEYSMRTAISVPPTSATEQVTQPEEDDLPNIVVKVLRQGNGTLWSLNNSQPVALEALEMALRQLAARSTDLKLILDVNGAVPLGDVVATYDACLVAGFAKIQFAATKEGAKRE